MYLLDANVFIDAKNKYFAFDIVPAFWDWLLAQHLAGKVFTVQSVYDEVVGGGDDLAQWMKAQPASFRIAPGSADSAGLTTVSAWVNGAARAAGKARVAAARAAGKARIEGKDYIMQDGDVVEFRFNV